MPLSSRSQVDQVPLSMYTHTFITGWLKMVGLWLGSVETDDKGPIHICLIVLKTSPFGFRLSARLSSPSFGDNRDEEPGSPDPVCSLQHESPLIFILLGSPSSPPVRGNWRVVYYRAWSRVITSISWGKRKETLWSHKRWMEQTPNHPFSEYRQGLLLAKWKECTGIWSWLGSNDSEPGSLTVDSHYQS